VFKIKRPPSLVRTVVLIVLLTVTVAEFTAAQCITYNRIYANTEEGNSNVGGAFGNTDVTNNNNALGNNLTNYSSIAIPSLYLTRYQRLKFPQIFTGSAPIHIKLGSEVDLTVAGLSIEIQAYNAGIPVGTAITLSSGILLNLLAGPNISDVVIPSPGPAYDAVQVNVTGGLLSAGKINIYAAYVNNQAVAAINCESAADIITGSTSGVLSALNGVSNAFNAIDGDLTTYAELRQNVGVAGYVHLTAIYPSVASAGDSISLIIKVPGTSVLDLSVFTNLNVTTYHGNTVIETIPANSSLIGLRLLDATNHIYQFTYPSTAAFDRISVQSGGLATALSSVYIYDIRRIIQSPKILIDAVNVAQKSICKGESTTLTVSPTTSCTTYKWYNAPTAGTLLHTGTSYQPSGLVVGTHTFYVEAVRDGCTTSVSERTPTKIIVNPLPSITLGNNLSICLGTLTASLPFTATSENPTSYSINWNNTALTNITNETFPSGSSITITIPQTAPTATYTGTITVKNGNGCSSNAKNFDLTIHPIAPIPTVIITSN